jgi:peptidoglycan-associated lipoprotein
MNTERVRQVGSHSFFATANGLACMTLAFVAGCAHTGATPAVQAPVVTEAEQPLPVSTATTTSASIMVDTTLAKACRIEFNNIPQAPKFDFDKSALSSDDETVLDQVAKCVTTGALKGRSLQLVGRADPRGEVEYNMALGASRASSVLNYLARLGVDRSTLGESSRGKMDATGTDEDSWAKDRRVDVNLR